MANICSFISLIFLVYMHSSGHHGANAVPIERCTQVLLSDPPSGRCILLRVSTQLIMKREVKTLLEEVANITQNITDYTSCHPNYTSLTQSQRGANTGINPSVDRMEDTDLGQAVDYWQHCMFPAVHDITGSESELQMNGELFNFAVGFRALEEKIATLVTKLKKLARSDNNLSVGTACIIPSATCIVPDWTTAGQVTPSQDYLRQMINVLRSIHNYSADLVGMRYFTLP